MRKHEVVNAKFAAIMALSQRARVAFGCCMVEHTWDIYRLGPVTYRVGDLPPGTLAVAPEKDLLEACIELGWRFVADGSFDPAVLTALVAFLKAAVKARAAKEDELLMPALGPMNATADTLTAITDPTPAAIKGATGRAGLGIGNLVMLGLDDDDPVPDKEEEEESVWQLHVAQRLVALGDQPITRAAVADLLGKQLTWRARLDGYAAQSRARKTR